MAAETMAFRPPNFCHRLQVPWPASTHCNQQSARSLGADTGTTCRRDGDHVDDLADGSTRFARWRVVVDLVAGTQPMQSSM